MPEILRMYNEDLNASADTTQEAFDTIYALRGWDLMEPVAAEISGVVGRPVVRVADATNDELRQLLASRSIAQPPASYTKDQLIAMVNGESDVTPAPESTDGAYDPADHNYDEVIAHLESATDVERDRVLALERDGKKRKTVLEWAPTE